MVHYGFIMVYYGSLLLITVLDWLNLWASKLMGDKIALLKFTWRFSIDVTTKQVSLVIVCCTCFSHSQPFKTFKPPAGKDFWGFLRMAVPQIIHLFNHFQ